MRALVYNKGSYSLLERPIPKIAKGTDAVVKIKKTTICGTDLHILKGSVKTCTDGRILGHEGVGVITEIGRDVQNHKIGDLVLISCITSCGKCPNCARGFYGHCKDGGWMLGNTIDGCQAEFVRVPHADNSLHSLDKNLPSKKLEGYVMMSDILPTGLEVGVQEGQVTSEKTVCVVGAGPVGLACVATAKSLNPKAIIMVDRDANRLKVAQELGATHVYDNSDNQAAEKIMKHTNGNGVDVAIEAIGTPTGWDICENIVAAGGNIAILGVHGKPVTLHLERMWYRNFTLTAGLVHTTSIQSIKKRVDKGEILPEKLISHHFRLSELETAYDVFGNAAKHNALKVIIAND